MQKRNLIITALFAVVGVSSASQAADTTGNHINPQVGSASEKKTENIDTNQEHILELMQNDYSFEAEKRSLQNELALAKIRSDIQKTNADMQKNSNMPVQSSVPNPVEAMSESADVPASIRTTKPRIILISQVAGVLRVAVESGQGVKLVGINEHFSIDGKKYTLSMNGNKAPDLREIAQ